LIPIVVRIADLDGTIEPMHIGSELDRLILADWIVSRGECFRLANISEESPVTCNKQYLLEIRKQVIPAPTRIPKLHPSIEVILISSIPDHTVENTPATDHSSHRYGTCSPIKLSLRNSAYIPIIESANIFANIDRELDHILAVIPWHG
jgi:hypothetical protein